MQWQGLDGSTLQATVLQLPRVLWACQGAARRLGKGARVGHTPRQQWQQGRSSGAAALACGVSDQ